MENARTKAGHGVAKALGIKLDYRNETGDTKLSRGESVFSVESADNYVEYEPTIWEWMANTWPSGHAWWEYFKSLFPFVSWIHLYNLQWLAGDLVAGITIGAVVIPQGMAYAKLAELPVEFGLYSSFMGVLVYWFFATSKDITIGPVAVVSTITGNVVLHVQEVRPDLEPHVVASALAIVAGGIVCFLGLIRLGWLVDFISLASISAFMTGAAINIACGQVRSLMGISADLVDTRDSTYRVIINTLKHLPDTSLDAALGLSCLAMLYLVRSGFNYLARKQPNRRKIWFFCNTLRSVFVILLYTLIGWLCNLDLNGKDLERSPFAILGEVPRGFQDAGVPVVTSDIVSLFASELPATVIVLLIEHISIAKSFGRINNYTINPSQELVAIGVTNLLSPFVGGYPATGSFSRTAIKSKAGVRTPFAGVITAAVVLIAIYALTAVFFYIPNSVLSAVIIHAVGDLVTPPNTVYQFWRISPIEVIIFFAGVLVTVFSTIEYGVYTTVCASLALLLFRVFKARGRFLGRVKIHSVIGDHLVEGSDAKYGPEGPQSMPGNDPDKSARNIFLPIDHEDGSNPLIHAEHPYPGIFIYRFSEGYNYPNANHYLDYMTDVIFKETRRTNPHSFPRLGDRPWNDAGRSRKPQEPSLVQDDRPTLKAIILDFSSVNNVDLTSVQHLIDVRNQLDRYTTPEKVQWHFACINNRWTKRALAAAGFGYPSVEEDDGFHRWKAIFSVAEMGGFDSAAAAAEDAENRRENRLQQQDIEAGRSLSRQQSRREEVEPIEEADSDDSEDLDKQLQNSKAYKEGVPEKDTRVAVVQGLNRPYFHIDLTSALQSAIHTAEILEAKHGPDHQKNS
ncbi:sulfate permease [Hortaea werneckii]|nr:sulfate permease [Hortaea werneckii]